MRRKRSKWTKLCRVLQLNPSPSRLRWLLALVLYALALAALFHSGAPGWLKFGLTPALAVGLWREGLIFLGRRDVAQLRLGANSVQLRLDGQVLGLGPLKLRHCSEWLVIIEFTCRGAATERNKFVLVLFPDSLPADELRRLRRWIGFEGADLL